MFSPVKSYITSTNAHITPFPYILFKLYCKKTVLEYEFLSIDNPKSDSL